MVIEEYNSTFWSVFELQNQSYERTKYVSIEKHVVIDNWTKFELQPWNFCEKTYIIYNVSKFHANEFEICEKTYGQYIYMQRLYENLTSEYRSVSLSPS